jgi:hypothetical protein
MVIKSSLNHPQSLIIIASLTLNIALWLLILILFPHNNPTAVLHYSVGIGIDFIGSGRQILILPSCGLIIIVGNLILGTSIKNVDRTSAYLIWSIMPVVQIILIAAFTLVYFANN